MIINITFMLRQKNVLDKLIGNYGKLAVEKMNTTPGFGYWRQNYRPETNSAKE